MAAGKRLTPEQIVARLRDAEKLQAQGSTIPQVCKKLGVSEQTFYRWRSKYGALKEDEAIRLKTLEQENARLKRIVAEQALDISMLKDLSKGNF
jgi:putative transposase